MSNELVINSTQKSDRIVLLQEKKIVEYHVEEKDNNFTVGDIYLGVVKRSVQGLNAAFIDLGYEKDAFLHYLDLGPNFATLSKFVREVQNKKGSTPKINQFKLEPEINKLGKISQVIQRNQPVLVQVIKEPISTKGPRLSCEISLAGRYLVLVPFANAVNISKKITSKEERNRLQRLLSSIKPPNYGVIVRTVAEGKDVAELDRDLRSLIDRWEAGIETLRFAQPREKIIGELGRASALVRDLLNESFDSISVDDRAIYDEIKGYIKQVAPDKERIVKLHNGKVKLFESLGIEKQLKSLFGKSVSLDRGGYVIIEHTEALHVIDVNSGNKSNAEEDQEATAINVNLDAVKEIARQLRIRDMGGIIIIDFIDMRKAEHKRKVYEAMKDEMKRDRSRSTVLPLTKFGLMQITRQRVRPELNIMTREVCPSCNGSGTVSASILVADLLEANVDYLLKKQNEKSLQISLHPYLYAYFTKGDIFRLSRRVKWLFKYGRWVKMQPDSSLPLMEFKFTNKLGEEIQLNANPKTPAADV